MIERFFHRWEQRLADVSRHDRVVRAFEWGTEWIGEREAGTGNREPGAGNREPGAGNRETGSADLAVVDAWVDAVMSATDAFFTPEPTRDYALIPASDAVRSTGEAGTLTFPSGFTTPHPKNNLVHARFFPANPFRRPRPGRTSPRRAVVVLAQWNSDPDGHIGLCRLLSRLGIASLRISLPYHDQRMPPELTRADYIVSANVGRTAQVCRQAVLDARRAIAWLAAQGYR